MQQMVFIVHFYNELKHIVQKSFVDRKKLCIFASEKGNADAQE
jgi:hypothetical protein